VTKSPVVRLTQSRLVVTAIFFTVLQVACTRGGLDAATATNAIKHHRSILPTDSVSVQAISQPTPEGEAIVKTSIDGTVYNLKLRRYDTGWQLEFAETKSGSWIDADVIIVAEHEKQRAARATEWAAKNKDQYRQTAALLVRLSSGLPRRPDRDLSLGWLEGKAWEEGMIKSSKRPPEEKQRLLKDYIVDPPDAWGTPTKSNFDSGSRVATFLSAGPNKKLGDNDDIALVNVGRQEWDASYRTTLWNYYKSWVMPEGLDDVVAGNVDTSHGGRIESRKVMQE
jgi:hypothetical protein